MRSSPNVPDGAATTSPVGARSRAAALRTALKEDRRLLAGAIAFGLASLVIYRLALTLGLGR